MVHCVVKRQRTYDVIPFLLSKFGEENTEGTIRYTLDNAVGAVRVLEIPGHYHLDFRSVPAPSFRRRCLCSMARVVYEYGIIALDLRIDG
jgi:hypothetical protein